MNTTTLLLGGVLSGLSIGSVTAGITGKVTGPLLQTQFVIASTAMAYFADALWNRSGTTSYKTLKYNSSHGFPHTEKVTVQKFNNFDTNIKIMSAIGTFMGMGASFTNPTVGITIAAVSTLAPIYLEMKNLMNHVQQDHEILKIDNDNLHIEVY